MNCIIDNQLVLSRAPEGPLATQIGPFARFLRQQGYRRNSIQRQVRLAAGFSRWLKRQAVPLRRLTADHPPRYFRFRARQVRPSLGDAAALRHLLDFLRAEGVMSAQKRAACPRTPAERWAQAYAQHLQHARGLASATIATYVPFIRRFLEERFGDGPVTLSQAAGGRQRLARVRYVFRAAPCHLHHAGVSAGLGATTFPRSTGVLGATAEFRARLRPVSQRHRSAHSDPATGLVALPSQAGAPVPVLRARDWPLTAGRPADALAL
jgi:hypothetical protein